MNKQPIKPYDEDYVLVSKRLLLTNFFASSSLSQTLATLLYEADGNLHKAVFKTHGEEAAKVIHAMTDKDVNEAIEELIEKIKTDSSSVHQVLLP
ncbi:MAG: hypothetical protein F6K62_12820 [Sphaerospermopsis sp. SIO1G2]|nr:hypothetical protein [Sphaerospermopsis sp. SIO1G2]